MARSPWRQKRWIRPRLGVVASLAVAAIIAIGSALFAPPQAPISGRAVVVDGDTLRIGERRVRLLGLDAPELEQSCTNAGGADWACGKEAKRYVIGLVEKRTVTCMASGRDAYGRALAKCDAGEGDLGAQIVGAGWAVADYGYIAEAASAQRGNLGIWAGSFIQPAEWRRSHGTTNGNIWDWITSWFHS